MWRCMKEKWLFFILLMFIGLVRVAAQDEFRVDAELRPRFEVRRGYQKLAEPGDAASVLFSQRTRLKFSYLSERLDIVVSPQDVRIWGDEENANTSGVTGNDASLDLFEGYADLKFSSTMSLAVGRMILAYDNEWLLGRRNWNQNGISSDAILLKLNPSGWKFHLGWSWNSLTETLKNNFYPPNRYKSMGFLWINRYFSQDVAVSFLQLSTGQTPSDTTNKQYFRNTSGIYFKVNKLPWSGFLNFYHQYGRNNRNEKVSALLYVAEASYNILHWRPAVGLVYTTGNRANTSTDHVFDLAYSARHNVLGNMDYFKNLTTDTHQGGLTDVYARVEFMPSKSLKFSNTSHYFWLAQTNELTPSQKKLGFENDMVATYNLREMGNLEVGYLFFLPTQGFKEMQSVDGNAFSHFFYVQLTIFVKMFHSENKKEG